MKKDLKVIENEVRCDNNAEMKCGTDIITKASSMKNGQHQTINNTVHHCQTPFKIAVILEQLSNFNNSLREKINRNMFVLNSCATAKEHTPKS